MRSSPPSGIAGPASPRRPRPRPPRRSPMPPRRAPGWMRSGPPWSPSPRTPPRTAGHATPSASRPRSSVISASAATSMTPSPSTRRPASPPLPGGRAATSTAPATTRRHCPCSVRPETGSAKHACLSTSATSTSGCTATGRPPTSSQQARSDCPAARLTRQGRVPCRSRSGSSLLLSWGEAAGEYLEGVVENIVGDLAARGPLGPAHADEITGARVHVGDDLRVEAGVHLPGELGAAHAAGVTSGQVLVVLLEQRGHDEFGLADDPVHPAAFGQQVEERAEAGSFHRPLALRAALRAAALALRLLDRGLHRASEIGVDLPHHGREDAGLGVEVRVEAAGRHAGPRADAGHRGPPVRPLAEELLGGGEQPLGWRPVIASGRFPAWLGCHSGYPRPAPGRSGIPTVFAQDRMARIGSSGRRDPGRRRLLLGPRVGGARAGGCRVGGENRALLREDPVRYDADVGTCHARVVALAEGVRRDRWSLRQAGLDDRGEARP